MIYTVTFNPSIDYVLQGYDFVPGVVNRVQEASFFAGGKGINISYILKNLEVESVAMGFVAGFTGREIQRILQERKIQEDFVFMEEGASRINVKLLNQKTELNATGPVMKREYMSEFYDKIQTLQKGDVLVLAGSLLKGMDDTTYKNVMKKVAKKGALVAVDTTKDALGNILPLHPFIVKPNHHELGELLGREIISAEDALSGARELQRMGAENVLVSMAEKGAVFVDENGKEYRQAAPEIQVVNPVGAGDSLLAGFLASYIKNGDYEKAFRFAVCAGSASAAAKDLANKEEILSLWRRMS